MRSFGFSGFVQPRRTRNARAPREAADEVFVDLVEHVQPLHREARLTGVPEAGDHRPLDGRLRSASGQTIIGSDPPSSSVIRLNSGAASAAMCLPVSVSPVNATRRISRVGDERVADRRSRGP